MQKMNENYNLALKLIESDFSHESLIKFLKEGSVIERQFAALTLDNVKSSDEAAILMSNLTGVDGKIREAVALKISEITKKSPQYFQDKSIYQIFSDATIDIDGNVCRLAIMSSVNLIDNQDFAKFYAFELIKIIKQALEEISKFTFKDKKYKINKQIFKIYWCLEALIKFYSYVDINKLKEIIKKCSILPEYTIREKCAKLLNIIPIDDDLFIIKKALLQDDNYYVRAIFE